MNVEQAMDYLRTREEFAGNICLHHEFPAKPSRFVPIPPDLHPSIVEALAEQGIQQLYSHQAEAYHLAMSGKNVVITTPTASGKTFAYFLPVMMRKISNPHGKHLFLFPTKALTQDQLALYRRWQQNLGSNWNIHTFDGDTPPQERRNAKKAGDFILTNPDMLHSGILPHHTTWKNLFENLETIVVDEMHTYIGVFGSHVANVFRRLLRIARHYGSNPAFIFSSATIANPAELAESLTGEKFDLVSESGAPEGPKHFLFYNPPKMDKTDNRQSPYKAAAEIGEFLLKNGIPTIFFARSRIRVELLTTLLQNRLPWHLRNKVKGYRGGYLPLERRAIERDLREGNILAVVSTNALELGIDIGMLNAVVSVGYPGRISSLLQQFGRAGRKKESAMAVMIATPSALDQFLMNHPGHILEKKGEAAIIHPDNMLIYMQHLKCAAYEMRFHDGDTFGEQPVDEYLRYLVETRLLIRKNNVYLWSDETYPASSISLRSAAQDNFVIVDKSVPGAEKVIGEVDYFSAPTMIHDEAIYIHQGRHFYVDALKWDERRAEVKQIESDYFTDAHQKVHLSIIARDETRSILHHRLSNLQIHWGEVTVVTRAYLYKKIKMMTSENLGWGEIHTPEIEMHTQAAWLEFNLDDPTRAAIMGQLLQRVSYVLKQLAPLVALCDQNDITALGLYKNNQFHDHALVFYDRFPGGVGLSFRLMKHLDSLLTLAISTVEQCDCENGCPACIGVYDAAEPVMDPETEELILQEFPFKTETLDLLREIQQALSDPVQQPVI